MLSANQLGIAITAVLVAAIALGWILHWIWLRLAKEPQTDAARMDALIDRLHEADHAREEAENAREMAENALASREAEMKVRIAAMQERMEGAIVGREAELEQALREARADADAAMSGLYHARQHIMALEAEIDELLHERR